MCEIMGTKANYKSLKSIFAVSATLFFLLAFSVFAEPPKKKPAPAPTGPDLYSNVWKKVRPNPKAHPTGTASAVAGLRGDEKAKFLKPYWKGEKKTETPDAAAFREAGKLMDTSEFAKAEQALVTFITQFPGSPLIPKVKLALAVCYAQLGRKDEATKVLSQWLTDYPQSELAPDAKALLADMKK